MNELELKTNARRAQGGLGLVSRTISTLNPQVSIPLIPSDEREEERTRRRAPGGRAACNSGHQGKRERERVRGFLTPTTLNPKD